MTPRHVRTWFERRALSPHQRHDVPPERHKLYVGVIRFLPTQAYNFHDTIDGIEIAWQLDGQDVSEVLTRPSCTFTLLFKTWSAVDALEIDTRG